MKVELEIKSLENVGEITPTLKKHFVAIFEALISSGSLVGVKGGKTVIHFDEDGVFQKVQLDYYPWRRKRTAS